MQIKNIMEDIVFNLMDGVLGDINICRCEKCLLDIAAIVLNELPSRYIVTEKGEVFSKTDTLRNQFEVDVISAITRAAILVKRRPQHG